MSDPNDLQVWHRALDASVLVHGIARRLRAAYAPGLRNQICRASASIPANIAEGARYDAPAEFARFLRYAIGSTGEVESHLVLASRLSPGLPDVTPALQALTEIRRMLHGLRDYQVRKAREAKAERRRQRRSAP